MAVTTGTINVNSGNASWTRAHVMNALETLFGTSHLNWNSGTQQTGVPVCCLYPGHDGTSVSQNSQYNDYNHENRMFDENGYWGSRWAAPIASLIIEKYINGEVNRKWLEQRMINGSLLKEYEKPYKFEIFEINE